MKRNRHINIKIETQNANKNNTKNDPILVIFLYKKETPLQIYKNTCNRPMKKK